MCMQVRDLGYEEEKVGYYAGIIASAVFFGQALTNYPVRAAPLVRVIVKFTVKNAVCGTSSAIAYGVFDREFGFDSHEWRCSQWPCVQEPECIIRLLGPPERTMTCSLSLSLSLYLVFVSVSPSIRGYKFTHPCRPSSI